MLKAILSLKESLAKGKEQGSEEKMRESFQFIDAFDVTVQKIGFKQTHIEKLIDYSKILQQEMGKAVNADIRQVEFAKQKLEKNARILLRVQELVTN